jgi:hypothetical protein
VSGSEIMLWSSPDDLSGHACNNERAIPPWMAFIEDSDKYFGSDEVPASFKLQDPSKMKDPQVMEILTFWYSKQESEGVGFKFLHDPKVNRKKRSQEDSDGGSDSDVDTEAEADDKVAVKSPSRGRATRGRSKKRFRVDSDSDADGHDDEDAKTPNRPRTSRRRSKKRSRKDSESDSDADAKTPSRHRTTRGQSKKRSRDSECDSDADPDANRHKTPSNPRTTRGRSMSKGKGKRKMEETPNERWTDHIVPDSRRRKQRVLTAGEDGESGEDFDFASVDLMESSEDEDVPLHGQHEAGHPKTPIPITAHSVATSDPFKKGPTGKKSTMAPRSKQRLSTGPENIGMKTKITKTTPQPPKRARHTTEPPGVCGPLRKFCLFHHQVHEPLRSDMGHSFDACY